MVQSERADFGFKLASWLAGPRCAVPETVWVSTRCSHFPPKDMQIGIIGDSKLHAVVNLTVFHRVCVCV